MAHTRIHDEQLGGPLVFFPALIVTQDTYLTVSPQTILLKESVIGKKRGEDCPSPVCQTQLRSGP
jgi:hypothetical protein